jgi:hypothetical protein
MDATAFFIFLTMILLLYFTLLGILNKAKMDTSQKWIVVLVGGSALGVCCLGLVVSWLAGLNASNNDTWRNEAGDSVRIIDDNRVLVNGEDYYRIYRIDRARHGSGDEINVTDGDSCKYLFAVPDDGRPAGFYYRGGQGPDYCPRYDMGGLRR